MKNNKIIIMICVLIFSINMGASIRHGNKSCEDMYVIYPVADSIESDNGYRNLLGKYVSLSMRCNDCAELNSDSLEMLFVRPSFELSILYLCTPENYSSSNIYYEDDSRWEDSLPYLIGNCSNKNIQYRIADELLKQGSDIGLIALWDSCNINNLPHYNVYKKELISKQNYYLLGNLAIIAHNEKNEKEYKKLLHMIKKYHKTFWHFIKRTIVQNEHISFYSYYSTLNEEYFISPHE